MSLTPPWVTPLILLVVLFGLAAAIWRGRRLGALVAERLPVVVRANETMEGRARLYERAGSREHALDSLRIGALARLAKLCGLPRRATLDDVIDAVAALTGAGVTVVGPAGGEDEEWQQQAEEGEVARRHSVGGVRGEVTLCR